MKNFFISVDEHVQEHPEVWTRRISKQKWGRRIPHVEQKSDGSERWVVDDREVDLRGVAEAGTVMPDRNQNPQRWRDVPSVVYDPRERLQAMDRDGVDYAVLYPTVSGIGGQTFGRIEDPELEIACVRAYNDWLIEEWASVSERFIPQCIVPIFPVDAAVAEIRRAVANGHKGVIYPAVPMDFRNVPHINDSIYDQLWAICQELAVPICFHAGSSTTIQIQPPDGYSPALATAFRAITQPASMVSVLVNLVISRILLRFPELKVIFAGSTLGWGAYLLEYTDYQFKGDQLDKNGYDLKPSEMFKRQCFLVGWYGRAGLQARGSIGTENILWSTEFLFATSTWPNSSEYITKSFEGLPESDRHKILWENAAKLYKIQVNFPTAARKI
jgi:predicted TIM-barrel fold metal-dependent hydrolase